MKTCKLCKKELDESNFYSHKRQNKSGETKIDYAAICKHCYSFKSKDPEILDNKTQSRRRLEQTPEGKYRKLKNTKRKYQKFEVSFEKFVELLNEKCYYCGDYRAEGTLCVKDIDQDFMDNNTIPVCKSCNYRKARMRETPEKFLKRTARLYGQTPEQKEEQEKLVGQRFNKLLVISIANRAKSAGRRYYTCLCDCGKTKDVREDVLKNGDTKSCGCYRTEYMSNRFDEEFVKFTQTKKNIGVLNSTNKTEIEKFFDKIKWRAHGRKIDFELTIQDLEIIYEQNCFYCGKTAKSLDRVDSNKGYTTDNVVKCCTLCNSMKSTLTQKEFYNHIKCIYDHILEHSREL